MPSLGLGFGSSFSDGSQDLALFNFQPSQFTSAKAGVAKVKAGTGRSKWIFPGDSTTWGDFGGDTNGLRNNAHNNAVPAVISAYLTANGIPSAQDNLYATGANTGLSVIADFRNSYKPGLNANSPWAINGGSSMGGNMFSATGADATGFVYTPEVPVTDFEIGDLQSAAAGAYTYAIDGGSTTTVTQTNATTSRQKQFITGLARGTHTLTIKETSGTAFLRHIKAWDSTVSQVDIYNAGRNGSVTADWIVNAVAYSSLGAFTEECSTADLVACNLAINEYAAGTTQANFKSRYQTIINAGIAGGATFLLIVPHQTQIADPTVQGNFRQWIKDLALLNNLPCLDLQTHFGDWASMNAAGYMFNSGHCNKAGYAAEGAYIASVLKTWTGG